MNARSNLRLVIALSVTLAGIHPAGATVTYTDNFNTPINYQTNGVVGTIWDGLYLGAGEIDNSTGFGSAPGSVSVADADITGANLLTFASVNTDWENAADDGVFLFKVITNGANFDMSVHVIGPINTSAYNFPGLMVRAFGPGGSPAPNSAENSLLWARFDEFSIANMTKNNVNGAKTDTGRGTFPNTNYWLRMTRSGSTFTLYERGPSSGAWTSVGTVTRSDFASLPLQVGIEHADFGGGTTLQVQYGSFSITITNMGPFGAAPSPASGLTMSTNANGNLVLSWTAGAGSSGSLVSLWPASTPIVKEAPANGIVYTANASYGSGGSLPGAGTYVVYAGSGTTVTVSNAGPGVTYNAAVFAYTGSAGSITYSRTPATATITIPQVPRQPVMALDPQIIGSDVVVSFTANQNEWYWLQYSDSLNPPNWQNVVPGPVIATNVLMLVKHIGGAGGPQRFYRLQQLDPLFIQKVTSGTISSLQPAQFIVQPDQTVRTNIGPQFIGSGKLGNIIVKYAATGSNVWNAVQTATSAGVASTTFSTSPDGTQYTADYQITKNLLGTFLLESIFTIQQDSILWTLNLTNNTSQSLVVGDLALPLPMNTTFSSPSTSTMKHSFISGYGSFVFWMRPDSVGPELLMTPADNTKLEFWDVLNGYEAYIHSYVAGTNAAAQNASVTTHGSRWRQPNTSLTLAPGASQTYGFKFQWPNGYDAIRQALVNAGKIDVHIVPGMTVPTNLFAQVALQTTQAISSVTAEFPGQTQVQFLGTSSVGTNSYQLYQVQFSQLGENELTIQYGNSRTMYLEFFVTEPVETLIKKRAAYLVSHQINDPTKWYNTLYCDVNMNDGQLITPDNHDTLGSSFQVYEIASDDAGESRPAYMAAKESVFPVQSEVTSLDNYIYSFVWNSLAPTGGLQRTTSETSSYGIYGVPDWNNLRTAGTPAGSLNRGYDYPHIIEMYYDMYLVAKYQPQVTTYLTATNYLQRAWGTAMAMWSYGGGQATQVGLMNELVISDLIRDLQAEGMTNQAATLRTNWETKINFYVTGNADLFGSEYAFDSTGFESQQAYAKYAMQNLGSSQLMGSTNPAAFLSQAQVFINKQITANVFDRGWLETAYYYYGSDYRGDMGDDYVVTYMSQMGGWGLLDYALNFATNATDYLRLGYASYLNGWSTMNSGPPPNYGFWYPGAAYDGGCGGGFEPSPYNTTWLGGQPMHRGAWYYSAEQNLGFCGAVRSAATILADDPIFGRFCYGGSWQTVSNTLQVVPQDGIRKRFHAMLSLGNLHLVMDTDRFAAGQPVIVVADLSGATFQIETDNSAAHTAALHLTASTAGTYTVTGPHGTISTVVLQSGVESVVSLPIDAGGLVETFSISK